MSISIIKRACSGLLICTLLISSLVTQAFAVQKMQTRLSDGVIHLQTKLENRTTVYNKKPDDTSIPRKTLEIQNIYQNTPSDRYANEDEREVIIKGLMLTAGIHGAVMPLRLPGQIGTAALSAVQKHYDIIHAIDVLSRDYFMSQDSKEDLYTLVENYGGLSKETINTWLEAVKQQLNEGSKKPNAKHWWGQENCDKALGGNVPEVRNENVSNQKRADVQPRIYPPVTHEQAMDVLKDQGKVDGFFDELKKIEGHHLTNNKANQLVQLVLPLVEEYEEKDHEADHIKTIIFDLATFTEGLEESPDFSKISLI